MKPHCHGCDIRPSQYLRKVPFPMSVERHLVLQELTLLPSAEWSFRSEGWLVLRVTEGAGYWLNSDFPQELSAGDMLVAPASASAILRASCLGLLKIHLFRVQPPLLNGVLAMADGQQVEAMTPKVSRKPLIWPAAEPLAQRFSRITVQSPREGFSFRCRLLQLWADAVGQMMQASPIPMEAANLRDRFRQLLQQMSQAELAASSLSELAARLHCSERHLSRLFHEEFHVPFRTRQTELRLMRAREILADSDVKIIHVAYGSGYRHLGLFNAMFKKRFGMTPREWRRQNVTRTSGARPRISHSKLTAAAGALCLLFCLLFSHPARAQTNSAGSLYAPIAVEETNSAESPEMTRLRTALHGKIDELDRKEGKPPTWKIHIVPPSTNGPHFTVTSYHIEGNTTLAPAGIADVLTNVPSAFGTNVTFDDIRAALGDLQMAYRERGFATVSVSLPQQKLTNGVVVVQVTEGRIEHINVIGNRWYSSNNIMRALPSLHTNMLLNSHVFQRELDTANASRDRQIYPTIEPGDDPGTTDLTLKINDRFPLHGRVEINNQATPQTPDIRVNTTLQYDNLWDLDHQVGLQYSFDWQKFRNNDTYSFTPLDDPLIANYSGYYRIPLGGYSSVEQQIEDTPSKFGYNEVTHQFNLPPATGRPELTIFATRSISDTDVLRTPRSLLTQTTSTNAAGEVFHPLSITTDTASQSITLNEDLGSKFSIPLPQLGKLSSTISFGADYKHYRLTSLNTNENFFQTEFFDQQGVLHVDDTSVPQAQTPRFSLVNYFPVNAGYNGSIPDKLGTTFFGATANFTPIPMGSSVETFTNTTTTVVTNGNTVVTNTTSKVIHNRASVRTGYVSMLFNADRVQTIYKDWTVKLHADGQWADGALFSNEQYAMGGLGGVRGYIDGEAYGDTGWRLSIEPQTPLVNIGMINGNTPFWARTSVFLDYGEIYLLGHLSATGEDRQRFCGVGWGLTGNIGSHLDARLAVAFPLITDSFNLPATRSRAGEVHVYFGVGMQF